MYIDHLPFLASALTASVLVSDFYFCFFVGFPLGITSSGDGVEGSLPELKSINQ